MEKVVVTLTERSAEEAIELARQDGISVDKLVELAIGEYFIRRRPSPEELEKWEADWRESEKDERLEERLRSSTARRTFERVEWKD